MANRGVIFGGLGGSNQGQTYYVPASLSKQVLFPPVSGVVYPTRIIPAQPASPSVSAAFSADFINGAASLPSQMTLSRASSGTYTDSSGIVQTATSNVARFDYDGYGSPKGLMIEEQRTNVLWPSDISDASFSPLNSTTKGTGATGPKGSASVRLIENAGVGDKGVTRGAGSPSSSSWSGFVYAKPIWPAIGSKRWLVLGVGGSTTFAASFDIVTGQVAALGNTSVKAAIDYAGNGWWKCMIMGTVTDGASIAFGPSNTATPTAWQGRGTADYTGDGTSGLDVQLPQVENNATPSSFILTTTGAVTRSADIISSTDATWLTYKGWVVETENLPDATATTLLGVNTVNGLGFTTGNVVTTAIGAAQSTTKTVSPYNINRSGVAWDSTPRVSIAVDGGGLTTAANTPVTPTTLYFGNLNNGASGYLNGHIRMIGGYTTLSDSDLSAATFQGASFTGVTGPANITYAATLGALTQVLTGTVIDNAVVNQTLGPLGQTATGTVSNAAVVAQTLGALTQIATDAVLAQATTTQTLGVLGQAATATNLDHAVVSQTLGALSQVATGTVTDAITVAQNLGALTQAAAATHPDTAAVAQTLGALVQTATGGVIDTATAAQTLGALAQAATASAPAALTASQTLGALGQTTTGNAIVAAVASQTLGALAQAATGTVTDAATVAQTLGALAQTATGGVVDNAAVAQTLGALTQAATATVADPRSITATQTLGALAQALTGTVVDTATVAQALGPLGQSVSLTHADTATTAQTLGAIVQALTGAVIDTGTVNQALGALNQTATASTSSGFIAAQTLGGLVQALTGTVVSHATVAQALGGLQQTTAGGPVARIGAYTDTLPPLGQTATAGIPRIVTVSQALGALAQVASLSVPDANFAASQILGALGQVAASKVPQRVLANQVLGVLGQTSRISIVPDAHVFIPGTIGSHHGAVRGQFPLHQQIIQGGSMRQTANGAFRQRTIIAGRFTIQ